MLASCVQLQQEPSFKDPYTDILDRDHEPRMAWHDIHMSVGTSVASLPSIFFHQLLALVNEIAFAR